MKPEWSILGQIRLRECEIRLQNANALSDTLRQSIRTFAQIHQTQKWSVARPDAITVLVEAEACRDEYRAIAEEIKGADIPDCAVEALARYEAVVNEARLRLGSVDKIHEAISEIILQEDQSIGSADNP